MSDLDGFTKSNRLAGDRRLWSRVWVFARPHRPLVGAIVGLGFASTAILLSYPLVYGALVNQLVQRHGVPNVGWVVLGLLALTAVHVAVRMGQVVLQTRLTRRVGTGLQSELFDRLQRQEHGFFGVSNAGAITARTVDEAGAAAGVFTEMLNFAVGNLLTLMLTVVALLVLDWRSIAAVAFLALAVIPARRFEQRFRAESLQEFFSAADLKSYSAERLNASGNLLAKLDGDYARELAGFRSRSSQVWSVFERLGTVRAALASVVMFAVNAVALLLLVAALAWGDTHVAVGSVVAMIVYLRLLEGPLAGMADARLNIARNLIAFTRVLEVLDATPTVETAASPRPERRGPRGCLEFAGVSYAYPKRTELAIVPSLSLVSERADDNPPSLDHVSFRVQPGEIVAIVGRSGAGKSTIARLASGVLSPTAGRVLVDGAPVHDQLGRADRRAVAYVTQDTYLLHDTLRNNILYANPDATDRELHRACVAAGVHDFAFDLPLRYETLIGENGTRLSGGERQRIALARAILHDPALVVLDEATAHMDNATEAAIQAALDDVFASRSRLVIAHRLSTVERADTILVLDKGAIVERGTHTELLSRDGAYATLYAPATGELERGVGDVAAR